MAGHPLHIPVFMQAPVHTPPESLHSGMPPPSTLHNSLMLLVQWRAGPQAASLCTLTPALW